jgi:hypothetical protein
LSVFDDARAASRQARSLRSVGHRPFPLPDSRWTLGQTWEHLFWAHWPVSLEDVRARVPDELEIEEHDGSAWLSFVFFRVRALRARGALPVPGISSFLQLNVRTYVRGPDGLPGVWFFSIDASRGLAGRRVRQGRRARPCLLGSLPPDGRDVPLGARVAGLVPDRALPPLRGGCRRRDAP